MRKNEYNSLEEFINEYVGEWSPTNGHWFGLDFRYNDVEYRLHTGSMYTTENTVLPDGREATYGLYKLISKFPHEYQLLGEFADMDSLLETTIIADRKFSEIIIDELTEILGKD